MSHRLCFDGGVMLINKVYALGTDSEFQITPMEKDCIISRLVRTVIT